MSITADQLIFEFNSVSLDLVKNIAAICPNSLVGRNIKDIENAYKSLTRKNAFIETFVLKVLPHKQQIDEGNEDFFLKKDYSSDFENNELGSKVFEFKNIWKDLKPQNKNIVIQYMQILCKISQEYFITVYGL
jgi:hypothetical protein